MQFCLDIYKSQQFKLKHLPLSLLEMNRKHYKIYGHKPELGMTWLFQPIGLLEIIKQYNTHGV